GGRCRIWLDGSPDSGRRSATLRLVDPAGAVLLAADGVRLRRAEPGQARPPLLRELVGVAGREQPVGAPAGAQGAPVALLGPAGDPLVAAVRADPAAPAGTTRVDTVDGAGPERDLV